jgi:hypothetical protein
MTEQEKIKRTKIIKEYPLGNGDFFAVLKSPSGYYFCNCTIAGKNIPMEERYKYAGCAKKNAAKHIANTSIDYLNKSNKCGEVALAMKENELEKKSKELSGEN